MEDEVVMINELSEQVRRLRPDIQLWKTETEVILMEISCTYLGISYGIERVEQAFVQKSNKCNRLIEEPEAIVKKEYHLEVTIRDLAKQCP